MTDTYECADVEAEVSVRDGGTHESDDYQVLATAALDRPHAADWLRDKEVVIDMADGDSSVRFALDRDQARRLEGALGQILRQPGGERDD